MPDIKILTDSAALFVHKNFPGQDVVEVIPLNPVLPSNTDGFILAGPSDTQMQITLKTASQAANTVFAILTSGCLSSLPDQIIRLLKETSAAPRIVIIDTQSAGVGTGFLVEKAAEMAANGTNSAQIDHYLRQYCSAVYTTIILPDLSPLLPIGLVDPAQSNAAAVLGIQSIFSMEDGLPTSLAKVKNRKGAYEYLVEFLDEFDKFHLVALIQNPKADTGDLQVITDHLLEFFPEVELFTLQSNTNWQTIFGENSYGLVIISDEGTVQT